MGKESLFFSLLFFLTAFLSLFWGIHVIKLNKKSLINKMFLVICILLSIWSFSFGMANSTGDLQIALLWRRVSAIGWIGIYSATLHFLILLSRNRGNLKPKPKFMFLHVPAIILIYVFSFLNQTANLQHVLVKTDYGWSNIAENTIWNYVFYLYYITYIIVSLLVVWKWKNRFKSKEVNKQANLFFISIFVSLLLGSLTDILSVTILNIILPQMAPIFILFPVWAMYYSIMNYEVIKKDNFIKEELILTGKERKNIFNNISTAFCIGGVLGFIFEYKPFTDNTGNLRTALLNTLVLFSMGISIYFFQKIKIKFVKEALTMIVLVSSIPLVTFQFMDYASITIWAFPIIIIITSLVFNRKILLVLTTLVTVITQRIIWIDKPEINVLVGNYDYILRIGIIIVAFSIGYYVHNIYLNKIKENAKQIAFQRMNSEMSFELMDLNKDNFNKKVNKLLEKIGSFFEVDRTYLFMIDHEDNTMTYTNEWCNEGIKKEVGTIENIPLSVFPWWIDNLEKKGLVYIEDVNNMPKEAKSEQDQLIRQEVKSLVSLPIEGEGKMKGFIGIDSVCKNKKWKNEHMKMLNILSNLLANAMMKMDSEEEVKFLAYYDNLTGIPNRFMFSDKLKKSISIAKKSKNQIGVMFIDLDNFKAINDTMGHDGGDFLLKQVSCRIGKRLNSKDMVSRFGGDEFLIMLDRISDYSEIETIADEFMYMFSKPFIINDQEFFVTASAGVSVFPIDGDRPEDLIKNADTAMYKAKAKGKNQYSLCTHEMKWEVQRDMELSNDLYHAVDRNELIVHYQPQIDLSNGEINGVEALLRWDHPDLGMIPPNEFIPLAEKNNLINKIGEWVLKTSCAQNKKWQSIGLVPMKIGVNLSSIQFLNPNLVKNIGRILEETQLEAKFLELEITESMAIKESENTLSILNSLKQLGISIAIDDFGTEYSSLSRLKKLPIDRIKIDMEFIQGIEKNKKDKAVTMVIINLAKSLGLDVIAEGVESSSQLDFLNQKMCDNVQGFYYYKPMPAEEIEKILIEHKEKVLASKS